MDDVMMEFYSSVHACIGKEFGVYFDYNAVTHWDDHALKQTDLFGDGRTWWDWLKERDWLWATFTAVEGAIGGVHQLRRAGHYVEAVTSKPSWAEWTVWAWLGKWRPEFNRVTIVSSGQKKSDFTDADVLVDDNVDNCLDFITKGRRAVLFTRPWNGEFVPDSRNPRCDTWVQVVNHLNYKGGA